MRFRGVRWSRLATPGLARAAALGALLVVGGEAGARPLRFDVDSTADSPALEVGDGRCEARAGGCTLRAAVEEANASLRAVEIRLPAGRYVLGSGRQLFLERTVRISGMGSGRTIIDGAGLARVLEVGESGRVALSELTIQHGAARGADGGCVLNSGRLELESVSFRSCVAKVDPLGADGNGGAFANQGEAELLAVRIEGSSADGDGGGIANGEGASLTLRESELRENVAQTGDGGGLWNAGRVEIGLSTIAANRAENGGGIENAGGEVSLSASTLSENRAASNGGGLRSSGELDASNVTISGNEARGAGGGIDARGGRAELNALTITANRALDGGGIAVEAGRVAAANAIVAGNATTGDGAPDCAGRIRSRGHDLIGKAFGCALFGSAEGNRLGLDPGLEPLAENGGPTRTHALERGSPAIDAGSPAEPGKGRGACPRADQRGVTRPQDGDGSGLALCDVGAFELRPPRAAAEREGSG